jgi:hypothetical protein
MVNSEVTLSPAYPDSSSPPAGEQYGWLNYHFGHWEYDPGIGWTWLPGYVWSPSHVVWFTGYEYLYSAPLPPPDVVLPQPGETKSVVQGGHSERMFKVRGEFDQTNLQAILEKIQTHRVAATAKEILRPTLSLDFPQTLFLPARIPPPGPPPVPHFVFLFP